MQTENNMSNTKHNSLTDFFGKDLYIFLSALASIPIWLGISAYVNAIDVHEDELVSTAATACFIAGVFIGRYLAQFWSSRLMALPQGLVAGLVVLIVVCIAWLFFHADFPMRNRAAINLLLFWLPFMFISFALGILIKVVRAITQNQLRQAQAAAATNKSELHLLQSQLSPHFLFNTLNNLYGLSITQHEKIPPLLLKLSELLRYSVYEAGDIYVPLKDELAYIRNFIEFERIRIGERLMLHTDVEEVTNPDIKIAPMLLIVFIENAFKHAKNTAEQKIYVELSLKTWGNSILFSIRNSYSAAGVESAVIDKSSGFGLASVSKRLELLYPGQHELSFEQQEQSYKVMLQLKMK
jgi:hypothetical protein